MTKVMTSCQDHSYVSNNTVILRYHLCLIEARALDENEMSQVPVCYYVKNDILMRKWRPPDALADGEWTVNHQIMVPRACRREICSLKGILWKQRLHQRTETRVCIFPGPD